MPLPWTTTVTTPKRTNRRQKQEKLQLIELDRKLRDKGQEQQELDSTGKYVQRSETARKWTPPFDKDKRPPLQYQLDTSYLPPAESDPIFTCATAPFPRQ